MTKVYMAGSIDSAPDDGRGWRNDLQSDERYSDANVEFLNPLDEHDPQEYDFERSDVVGDDLSLLDEADGILLKYDHGRKCWGTPAEQGYALAVNRLTDDSLPVAVWWDKLNQPLSDAYALVPATEEKRVSLDDASPWLHDPKCAIGVYEDQTTALTSLLSSTGHGADNPYPCEADGTTADGSDEMAMLFEGAPLEEVLEVFCTWGIGNPIPRGVFEDIRGYDNSDVEHVIRFLDTLGVLHHRSGYAVVLEDTEQSRQLLEQFIPEHYSNMPDGLSSVRLFPTTVDREKTVITADDDSGQESSIPSSSAVRNSQSFGTD